MISLSRAWLFRIQSRLGAQGNLRTRFAQGVFWSVVGAVVSQAASLLASIITARLLGTVHYGEVGVVLSTVSTFGWFAGLGMGLTATKYVAELLNKDSERAGRLIGFSTIVALVSSATLSVGVYLAAPYLATQTLNAPQLVNELRWSSILISFTALNGVQIGVLTGFEAFRSITQVNLIRAVFNFPLVIAGVWFFGVMGAVWGMTLVALVTLIVSQITLDRQCARLGIVVRYGDIRSEMRVLLTFSLPTLVSGTLVGPVMWVGNALLVNQPTGYVEMGIFNAANQWRIVLMFIPSVVGQAIVPMLSSLLGENSTRSARKLLLASVGGIALITVPVALVLVVARNPVMALYGPGFVGQGDILAIVALAAVVLAVQTPVGQVLFASGRAWLAMAMNFGWAIVFLGICWFLTRAGWGARGLAMSYLVAYSIHFTWTAAFALYFLRSSQSPETTIC